eukprot:TRINITY_DN3220_c0_g2_i1.p1 TRINITY_DN3220_c0_g2~~TRINITY_DN3220_c0_g2_i1.p1  ORF type:complete len:628 (+),score=126.36 TRINITY_DN3220_c0_g2_i1:77-1885(+)
METALPLITSSVGIAEQPPARSNVRVQNADGFKGVAARSKLEGEPEWEMPNGSVVDVLEDFVSCEFKSQRGFMNAKDLLGLGDVSLPALAEVCGAAEGGTTACMRRTADRDTTEANVLCHVPNGPGAVKVLELWSEVRWKTQSLFLKTRHLRATDATVDNSKVQPPPAKKAKVEVDPTPPTSAAIPSSSGADPPAALAGSDPPVAPSSPGAGGAAAAPPPVAAPVSAAAAPAPPVASKIPAGEFLTTDMLGHPCNLLLEPQPDWQFELSKDKWKSYRPEDSVQLDRYWKAFRALKQHVAEGQAFPHSAKVRLMGKEAVVDLAAMTCRVGTSKPRPLRRQILDAGWLDNVYFCKAFRAALAGADMAIGSPPEETFDFRYNQDFRELKDDGRELLRGGERYTLPVGWKRFAVKVQGQYDGGNNRWLKEDESGWAVAYHGTSGKSLPGILATGFKAGPRQKFAKETGAGIYCTPWVDVAQHYSKPQALEAHSVQVVLQLRVKPSAIKKVTEAPTDFENKYWVINNTDEIRAYGVLIREWSLRDYLPPMYMYRGPEDKDVKKAMADLAKEAEQADKALAEQSAEAEALAEEQAEGTRKLKKSASTA